MVDSLVIKEENIKDEKSQKVWTISKNFVSLHQSILTNMARPIKETPILTGDDALRFELRRLEVENMSKEQRAENIRKLEETVAKARSYIEVCW